MACSFISPKAWFSSDFAPMKLDPPSQRKRDDRPHKAKNLLRAHMNELVSMVSSTSMCTALQLKHKNISAHLFAFAAPSLNFCVCMVHGPNTLNPTLVNGGVVSNLSRGRSAMC